MLRVYEGRDTININLTIPKTSLYDDRQAYASLFGLAMAAGPPRRARSVRRLAVVLLAIALGCPGATIGVGR
jgi:hypothetical protein